MNWGQTLVQKQMVEWRQGRFLIYKKFHICVDPTMLKRIPAVVPVICKRFSMDMYVYSLRDIYQVSKN